MRSDTVNKASVLHTPSALGVSDEISKVIEHRLEVAKNNGFTELAKTDIKSKLDELRNEEIVKEKTLLLLSVEKSSQANYSCVDQPHVQQAYNAMVNTGSGWSRPVVSVLVAVAGIFFGLGGSSLTGMLADSPSYLGWVTIAAFAIFIILCIAICYFALSKRDEN
jgi:preprotein translocase subunit YajC